MESIKRVPIKEEFKKNPELKEEDLQHLKEWYQKQPHFPKYIDENDLILFLHSNYYRLEPTKTTIENYLTTRTHTPEFFSNRDPLGSKELRKIMSTVAILPLEKRTPEGYGVMYSRLINLEPDRFVFNEGLRLYAMICELWLYQEGTIPGHVFVIDVQGVQMTHALRITPLALKKWLYYIQEAIPLRLKAMHFLNTTPVMDFILGLMKPFLKKELMEVLYLHQNTESLSKHVPIDMLPNETGGKAGLIKNLYAKVLKDVEDHREYFIEEESVMRVDESKRPGKPKSASDVFGVEGSFKKLDID
ncbi:alpha-tocopherol transfer protein-like [Copidosoma floridanum]|uniref:alpha-tocopherol transfer protein-like n=1 Tax=Copidosoma floridanum TaxID=29053 RepID=UPI0006C964FC|nr:alpha-tocopherol transfer protein-like [Copidosoma floridanum]